MEPEEKMLLLSGIRGEKFERKLKEIGQMEPDSVSFCEQIEILALSGTIWPTLAEINFFYLPHYTVSLL